MNKIFNALPTLLMAEYEGICTIHVKDFVLMSGCFFFYEGYKPFLSLNQLFFDFRK